MKQYFIIPLLIILVAVVIITSCKKSSKSSDENIPDYALAAADFGGFTLQLTETGGVTQKWNFINKGDSGTVTLVGVDDYLYTYSKSSKNLSVLKVSGKEFDMSWTSAAGGTFKELIPNAQTKNGVFAITK